MRFGTSVRFIFPASPATHEMFKKTLASMPPGSFIERPLGAYDAGEQAQNLIEVAAAARSAGLDGFLVGDNHAVAPSYANTFAPVPTLARLLAETGDMPAGMVVLAPFYQPVILAEQIGTLAAFARAPLIVTFANGGREPAFRAFSMELRQRARRLEEVATIVRALLAGERVSYAGRFHTLDKVQISPLPRVPVELWVAGTVPAAAERAGRLGDGWLTGQNATRDDLIQQLEVYQAAAVKAGRKPQAVLRRDIYVGESDADAHAAVDPILAEGYRGTGDDQLLIGGPETIVQKLRDYRALGFDYVMVRHIVGDHALMLRSFERIGTRVIPAIQDV